MITSIDATTTVMVPKEKEAEDDQPALSPFGAGLQNGNGEKAGTTGSDGAPTEGTNVNIMESPEQHVERIRLTHELLARQIEYYFSDSNLSRDTYVSTLRGLNDGYVPLSIIANFGKVQALAPYESAIDAVCTAAMEFSDLLEIVELDTATGKKVSVLTEERRKRFEDESNANCIWAVGTVSGKPIPQSMIQNQKESMEEGRRRSSNEVDVSPRPENAARVAPSKTTQPPTLSSPNPGTADTIPAIQNTIILREVSEGVDETVIRDLFNYEGCPSVEKVHLDLHNCWFVTINTTSRDEMVNIMMKLRTMKFPSGDTIKARLKSFATTPSPNALPPNTIVYSYPDVTNVYAPQLYGKNNNGIASNNNGNNNRKKRSSNNKKRNNFSKDSFNVTDKKGANSSGMNRSSGGSNHNVNDHFDTGNSGYQPKRRYDREDSSGRPARLSSSNNGSYRNTSNGVTNGAGGKSKKIPNRSDKKSVQPPPPSMGEVNFPSLPLATNGSSSKPFQVEKVPTEDEMMRNNSEKNRRSSSDASSTATTTSSSVTLTDDTPRGNGSGGGSTTIGVVVSGGYAAALLKPAAKVPLSDDSSEQHSLVTGLKKDTITTSEREVGKHQDKDKQKQQHRLSGSPKPLSKSFHQAKTESGGIRQKKKQSDASSDAKNENPVDISIQPPVWGRGSFADILAEKA